jgi:hypothetical protein
MKLLRFFAQSEPRTKGRTLRGDFGDSSSQSGKSAQYERLSGGPRWIRTRGPVCAPHVPEIPAQFAPETRPEKICTVSLKGFANHRLRRDLKSGLGIEAAMTH